MGKPKRKKTFRNFLVVLFSAILICAPLAIYIILWFLFSGISSLLLFIAGLGALVVGVSLLLLMFGIVSKKPENKLPWWIMCIAFSTGAFMIGIPSIFLYVPEFQGKQNEDQVAVYILCACIFLILLIYNLLLRSCIRAYYIENGIRKREIKTYTQGWRNYWFYEELNKQKPLGMIRFLIITSTCLYAVTLCLYVLAGWWWKPMLIIVGFLLAGLCILNGVLLVWARCKSTNRQSHMSLWGCIVLAVFAVWILGIGTIDRVCELF